VEIDCNFKPKLSTWDDINYVIAQLFHINGNIENSIKTFNINVLIQDLHVPGSEVDLTVRVKNALEDIQRYNPKKKGNSVIYSDNVFETIKMDLSNLEDLTNLQKCIETMIYGEKKKAK